ncbi:MAG: Cyclic 2,3-diphosphoglycerate synthetase [Acetothermia bacterium 64_32]|nr:MAG: Cyclic 2,3-diphosphoglycerate synthetase [Acetothermia bacterium 64_32]HAF70771.1 2,3-diphosphoglycerate synthetase [Candidatus Acetothermia bacterium]
MTRASENPRAIALIDGEHYLPVLKWALDGLRASYQLVGAVFLGGTEKIGSEEDLKALGVPVIYGKPIPQALREAVELFAPEVAVDLSDEPVVGYRERFQIASLLLSWGVRYVGQDFAFTPPRRVPTALPAIGVAGTGKRTGKTAVCGYAARVLKKSWRVGIVTMGRGGPEEPEVLHGGEMELTPEALVKLADQGRHAASDHFEDALMARVLTVGCRRCGGGMSGGAPFFSNVEAGAKLAEGFGLDLVLLEGSGSTAAPIKVDRQILIVGAHQPLDYIRGYFGPYRILQSHLVVLTGCEPPLADEEKVEAMEAAVREVNPEIPVIRTVFRPRPLEPVEGAKVFLATTAPKGILPVLADYLEGHYRCRVVGASPHLSKRPKLREDLASAPDFDVLLVELKAAGVDVGARLALQGGRKVVFVDNEPVGELDRHLYRLAEEAIREKKGGAAHG